MLYLAMTAASAGAFWWLHLRADRSAQRAAALAFDEDAGIAVHVARHEAQTRRQDPSTLHLLYGLLQVEAVTAAIGDAGADAAAVEDQVLAALAAGGGGELAALNWTLRRAEHSAHGASRRIGCADLWAYLGDGRAAAVLAKAKIDRMAALFRMAHGAGPPALPDSDRGTAIVELRDDPYTTKDFVVEALREGLGLDAVEAERIMEAVHTSGHGTIGPMAMATARTAVITMRDLAQRSQFPLWIGVTAASG
jgi:ATP-dependent Clp protease adapter protein ClpS